MRAIRILVLAFVVSFSIMMIGMVRQGLAWAWWRADGRDLLIFGVGFSVLSMLAICIMMQRVLRELRRVREEV